MKNKILILDNYDSFTYNLVQMVEDITQQQVDVIYNDQIEINQVENYDKIILSPGPGVPKEAGQMMNIIQQFAKTKSILGVCLGHQAIAESFGATLINLPEIYHGVATNAIQVKEHLIFNHLPPVLQVGRYHSWVVNPFQLPDCLEITSVDEHQMIMSLKHKVYDVHSVQYHPESILTPAGRQILTNFLHH